MERYNWSSVIRLNLVTFKLAGLWPNGARGYQRDLYTVYSCITVFLLGFLHTAGQVGKLLQDPTDLEVIIVVVCVVVSFIKIICFAANIKPIKELMVTLKSDMFQPTRADQVELFTPSLKLFSRAYRIYGWSIFIATTLFAMVPIAKNIESRRLPFNVWYPYNTSVSPNYGLTYGHQMVSVFFLDWVNLNINMFVTGFSVFAGAQLDILCDDLETAKGDDFDTAFLFCLGRHREVISYVKSYNRVTNWMIFTQLLASSIPAGLCMYIVSISEVFGNDFCAFGFLAGGVLAEIFIFCWCGNELQFKSRKVFVTAFKSQWLETSERSKRNLLFFMANTQKPLKHSALGVFDLSLENFLKIVKTAYSYFALVARLNSKAVDF